MQFTGILVAGDVSELVANNEVVVYELVFKRAERAFLAGLHKRQGVLPAVPAMRGDDLSGAA